MELAVLASGIPAETVISLASRMIIDHIPEAVDAAISLTKLAATGVELCHEIAKRPGPPTPGKTPVRKSTRLMAQNTQDDGSDYEMDVDLNNGHNKQTKLNPEMAKKHGSKSIRKRRRAPRKSGKSSRKRRTTKRHKKTHRHKLSVGGLRHARCATFEDYRSFQLITNSNMSNWVDTYIHNFTDLGYANSGSANNYPNAIQSNSPYTDFTQGEQTTGGGTNLLQQGMFDPPPNINVATAGGAQSGHGYYAVSNDETLIYDKVDHTWYLCGMTDTPVYVTVEVWHCNLTSDDSLLTRELELYQQEQEWDSGRNAPNIGTGTYVAGQTPFLHGPFYTATKLAGQGLKKYWTCHHRGEFVIEPGVETKFHLATSATIDQMKFKGQSDTSTTSTPVNPTYLKGITKCVRFRVRGTVGSQPSVANIAGFGPAKIDLVYKRVVRAHRANPTAIVKKQYVAEQHTIIPNYLLAGLATTTAPMSEVSASLAAINVQNS